MDYGYSTIEGVIVMKKWIIPVLFAAAGAIASLWNYDSLPESMVVHFGMDESPDRWMSRPFGAFLLPLLILAIPFLLTLSRKLEKNENKRARAEASIGSVMTIVSFMLLSVHAILLAYNLGYEVGITRFGTAIVGIVFLLLGNLLPRLPHTKQWPKLTDDAQRKASRLQGRFMAGMGFVFILLALLPDKSLLPGFFIALVVFILVSIGITLRYMKQR